MIDKSIHQEEQINLQQQPIDELRLELLKLKREKELNFDPRLHFFSSNIKGSNSNRSKGSNQSDSNGSNQSSSKEGNARRIDSVKQSTKEKNQKMLDAKMEAKKMFTNNGKHPLTCIICGVSDSITMGHIISSGHDNYDIFSTKMKGDHQPPPGWRPYKNDLDVFSYRNFIPLCGTDGMSGSCHNAFDKHLIFIRYDPFQKSFHMGCSRGTNEPSEKFTKLDNIQLVPPGRWSPYIRLLAWRARKCGTECGFTPDFKQFETMNQISENCDSIDGDARTTYDEVSGTSGPNDSDSEVSDMDNL